VVLHGHRGAVRGAVFDPDGTRLASVSLDGTLRLWDVSTWKPTRTISIGPPNGRQGLEGESYGFSPSGRHFALCNPNGTVYILRLPKSSTR